MSNETMTWVEDHLMDVFRVTGLFGKKPKPGIERGYSMVANQILHNSPCPGMTLEELSEGLKRLDKRGFLKLVPEKQYVSLSDSGFALLSQPGFNDRVRAEMPASAKTPRAENPEGALATVMAVAFGTVGN